MKLLMKIGEGQEYPKYYGFAYRNATSYSATVAIIPLNIIIAYLWRLWVWAKTPTKTDLGKLREKVFRSAYIEGRSAGYKDGIRLIGSYKKTIEDILRD